MESKLNIPDGGSRSEVLVFGAAGAVAGTAAAGTEVKDAAMDAEIWLGGRASLSLVLVVLPGVSKDISLSVSLNGEDSRVEIAGLYLCPDDERVNIRLNLVHAVPGCVSHQLFKGIVAGNARTSFHGLIRVAQDAQKTEAFQENHNLLLSDKAEARTKPQLEIYADDVKCSHGATIGRLDEEEQFYMRSRGISEEDAALLQMFSFLSPVVSRIDDEARRSEISELIASVLPAFTARG